MARPNKKAGLTYQQFKLLGLGFPLVEESTSYGTPALKVKGKLMARLKEDGTTVALRCEWEQREQRLALDPQVFFLTDHYRAHPWVLLRLAAATPEQAMAALRHAWEQSAPKSRLRQLVGK